MTQDDRIERLEDRVTRLETSIDVKLTQIFDKLNNLTVKQAKNECPNPGACVALSNDLQHYIRSHDATMLRVERLELQLISLNQQKAWIMGAWSVVAIVGAAIGSILGIIVSKYLQ